MEPHGNDISLIVEDILHEENIYPDSIYVRFDDTRMSEVIKVEKYIDGERYGFEVSMTMEMERAITTETDNGEMHVFMSQIKRYAEEFKDELWYRIEHGDRTVRYRIDDVISVQCQRCGTCETIAEFPGRTSTVPPPIPDRTSDDFTERYTTFGGRFDEWQKERTMLYLLGLIDKKCICDSTLTQTGSLSYDRKI